MLAVLTMVIGGFVTCKLRYKWMMKVREKFGMTHVIQGQFRFVIEIFFDLFISSILIIGMFRTKLIWNASDKICVDIQMNLLLFCIVFAVFLFWVTAVKIKPLLKLKRQNHRST